MRQSRRRKRESYERAVAVVRGVVHEWDPYGLLAHGAPADEWDSEIASIAAQIPRMRSAEDAAHAIARVFGSALGREGFEIEKCSAVGAQLYSRLLEAGFIEHQTSPSNNALEPTRGQ